MHALLSLRWEVPARVRFLGHLVCWCCALAVCACCVYCACCVCVLPLCALKLRALCLCACIVRALSLCTLMLCASVCLHCVRVLASCIVSVCFLCSATRTRRHAVCARDVLSFLAPKCTRACVILPVLWREYVRVCVRAEHVRRGPFMCTRGFPLLSHYKHAHAHVHPAVTAHTWRRVHNPTHETSHVAHSYSACPRRKCGHCSKVSAWACAKCRTNCSRSSLCKGSVSTSV